MDTMYFTVIKKNIISAFFLVFFLFYTISPISLTYSNSSESNSLEKAVDLSMEGFHFYLLDLFVLWVFPRSDQTDDPSSDGFLILKGKRAVVHSENRLHTVDTPALNHAASLDYLPSPQPFQPLLIVLRDKPKPLEGFDLLHSGPSPPSA